MFKVADFKVKFQATREIPTKIKKQGWLRAWNRKCVYNDLAALTKMS